MADISASASKLMIDWLLGGATPTQPTEKYVALSLGTPSSVEGDFVLRGQHRLGLYAAKALHACA
jgi:hypothetical protein